MELCFKLKIVDKGLFCIVLIGGLIGCCMLLIVLDDVGIFGVVWEWIIELFKFNRCWIFGILFLEDICEFLSLGWLNLKLFWGKGIMGLEVRFDCCWLKVLLILMFGIGLLNCFCMVVVRKGWFLGLFGLGIVNLKGCGGGFVCCIGCLGIGWDCFKNGLFVFIGWWNCERGWIWKELIGSCGEIWDGGEGVIGDIKGVFVVMFFGLKGFFVFLFILLFIFGNCFDGILGNGLLKVLWVFFWLFLNIFFFFSLLMFNILLLVFGYK